MRHRRRVKHHVNDGKASSAMKETQLFPPISTFLKNQGYEVQGEVEYCDLIAKRGDEPPVIVELKTRLNLELLLQAAERLTLSESVYIAFPNATPLWKRHQRRVLALCRRLGIGIITLHGALLRVNVRLDPLPYRLLAEFAQRTLDANIGGVTRQPIMTAYRQDALRCAIALRAGPLSLADLRKTTRVSRASGILQKDHYGWFERVSRGCYALSAKGSNALNQFKDVVAVLTADVAPGINGEALTLVD
jgi:hypothetical protein